MYQFQAPKLYLSLRQSIPFIPQRLANWEFYVNARFCFFLNKKTVPGRFVRPDTQSILVHGLCGWVSSFFLFFGGGGMEGQAAAVSSLLVCLPQLFGS